MSRPRKQNVKRDSTTGRSRGEPEEIAEEVIVVRERHLRAEGIELSTAKVEGQRVVRMRTATDQLSGSTLGRLLLRHRQDERNPGSINEDQYSAGDRWARLCYQHAAIHGYSLTTRSPSFVMMAGGFSVAPGPDEEIILGIRRRWSDCYRALMDECRFHRALRIRDVTYGCCVEDWPLARLQNNDYGHLRVGLNALWKVLS